MSKVVIEVGHGGRDPGAVANGLRESDVNLTMALAMQAELVRHGVTVCMSRVKDENDPLSQAIAEANAFQPDLAVGVHNNAGGGDGFEVYRQTNTYAVLSNRLAGHITGEVAKIGQNLRGVKIWQNPDGTDRFGWLREVKCPAVLCEGAFVDNRADAAQIDTETEQRAFGAAYARGVLAYLGIAYQPDANMTYGVVRQVIALSDQSEAVKYAAKMNQAGEADVYYYVVERPLQLK